MAVPKLRFKNDDGKCFPDWTQNELQEIAEINPKTGFLPNEFVYIDLESVEKGTLLKQTVISKGEAPSRAQRLLNKNDILFQMVRPYQGNNLLFDKSGVFVASTGYAQIRTREIPNFLYQYLHLEHFTAEVINRCTGTSYPAINSSSLATILINFPTNQEQTKIANFLTAVDEKIHQLTQKNDLLTHYKKGLMQQIFTQELRFKDDDGRDFPKWNYYKLTDLAKTFIGLVTTMTTSYVEEGVPLIRNSDIKPNKILKKGLIYLDVNFANQYQNRMLKINDVVTVHTGDVGVSAVIDSSLDGCLGFATLNTRITSDQLTPHFLSWFFNSHEYLNFALSMSTGDGRCNFNLKDFDTSTIPVPHKEEQKKIANFLTAIDDKISTTQAQLEAVKQYKQGLLQQMFV